MEDLFIDVFTMKKISMGAIEGLAINIQLSYASDLVCPLFVHLPSSIIHLPSHPYLL